MKKAHVYLLALCMGFFSILTNANTVSPIIRYTASSSSTTCQTAPTSTFVTPLAACQSATPTSDSTQPISTICNGYQTHRCYVGTTAAQRWAYPSLSCPTNSTLNGSTCTCNSGYTSSNGQCVQQTPQQQCEADNTKWWNASTTTCQNKATCTAQQQYNSSNNTCETINNCANLPSTPIPLSFVATQNAEVHTPTLEPFSSYEYLANNGCGYFINQSPSEAQCFMLQADSSPRKGYCTLNYVPTFQPATNQSQAVVVSGQQVPKQTSCQQGQPSTFGVCPEVQCTSLEWKNTSTNTCEPKPTCNPNQTYNNTNNTCTDVACPTAQYRPISGQPCQNEPSCQVGFTGNQGTCHQTECPSGTYRTSLGNACIPSADASSLMNCSHMNTRQGTTLSSCAIQKGISHFRIPTSNLCITIPNARFKYSDTQLCNIYPSSNYPDGLQPINTTNYVEQLTFTDTRNVINEQVRASYYGQCPSGTSLQTNGWCKPDTCLTNPQEPSCTNEFSNIPPSGGTGDSGDCSKEPEKCVLLTNIQNALQGEGTNAEVVITTLQTTQDNLLTDFQAQSQELIQNFYNSDLWANQFLTAVTGSPNPMAYLSSKQGSSVFTFDAPGGQQSLDMTPYLSTIHPAIAFGTFILFMFGIRDLILEKETT